MPFGGGMGMNRRRPFGGAFGGGFGGFGMMDDFDDMMGMTGMMGGMRGQGGGMGGSSQMMMSSFGGGMGGGGSFTSQTMCVSSTMGPDGKMRTEKFASSSVGDGRRGISETQQRYSNSDTGVDKMSLERMHNERGKKVVKERSSLTGDETQTEMFHGMTEEDQDDFHQGWEREAAPYLPQHASASARGALCGAQGRPQQQRAIGYDEPSATRLPVSRQYQNTGYQQASYPNYGRRF